MIPQKERKKAAERFQLESFIRASRLPWVIERAGNDLGEPDFLILDNGKRVGVEITQLFADKKGTTAPSSLKKNESLNLRKLNELANLYYSVQTIPIRVQFVGAGFADLSAVAGRLSELASGLVEMKSQRFEFGGGLIAHVLRLPISMSDYRRWDIVSDHIGWSVRIDAAMLEGAIAPKRERLKDYKRSVEEVVLLLYADRLFASGMITDVDALEADIGGFAAVYLFAFPDEAKQISGRDIS
jgi:hypothetical protein